MGSVASGGGSNVNGTQTSSATANQIGAVVSAPAPSQSIGFSNLASLGAANNRFLASQSAGSNGVNSDSFSQSGTNQIYATSAGGVLDALATGNQSALASVNSINTSVQANGLGEVGQSINTYPTSTQVARNSIDASGASASALIAASSQISTSSLNSSAITTPGAFTLGVKQTLGASDLSLGASNAAASSTTASNNSTVAAIAPGLVQANSTLANTLRVDATTLALSGGQNGTAQSTVALGNSATASSINGSATVGQASQSSLLGINQTSVTGALQAGALGNPFEQTTQSYGTMNLTSHNLPGPSGSVNANYLNASSTNGNAMINGSGQAAAQTLGLTLNSTAAGGSLSGSLNQQAATLATPVMNNTASAQSSAGGLATSANVSQTQTQSLNAISAAGGANLTVSQNFAAGASLGAANQQTDTSALGLAVINQPLQNASMGANTASLGYMSGSVVAQTANGASQSIANSLAASGGAALITKASQQAGNGTNIQR